MTRRHRLAGLVLAAGAGSRFGGPKALARGAGGDDPAGAPWVERVAVALRDGGCGDVFVVLGAAAERAGALVPPWARIVVADDWSGGLSRSLAAGIAAVEGSGAHTEAIVVATVDIPALPAAAVARVIRAAAGDEPSERVRASLARAIYGGRPGHPALIGADHFAPLARTLAGDNGAGPYLAANGALAVECGDLWSGADRDTPPGAAP